MSRLPTPTIQFPSFSPRRVRREAGGEVLKPHLHASRARGEVITSAAKLAPTLPSFGDKKIVSPPPSPIYAGFVTHRHEGCGARSR